ncbi:hypothetical protein NUW54_g13492 [Trametes sanguinea]|uniref:Uncharacterized protein n=1 Tax=Trametes sanguinea TaxID=158606 RepID=A0ACC1MMJ3_9APHY|nr:hypothetical protein NUW54_g13492 [Trametes sanguinea]
MRLDGLAARRCSKKHGTFVSKRKADATSRPKGATASSASAKPVSIADVVKAQPKPAQNEWGGFKVVNKKKKGSRA